MKPRLLEAKSGGVRCVVHTQYPYLSVPRFEDTAERLTKFLRRSVARRVRIDFNETAFEPAIHHKPSRA